MKNILFLLIFGFISSQVSSQVIYTDISPDTVIYIGDTLDLDINGDSAIDFSIWGVAVNDSLGGQALVSNKFSIGYLGSNRGEIAAQTDSYGSKVADGLVNGDTIPQPSMLIGWPEVILGELGTLGSSPFQRGNFINVSGNTYIGALRYFTLYCWIRVCINPTCTSLTLKDWGYESSYPDGLLAGEGMPTVGINGEVFNSNLVYADETISFSSDKLILGTLNIYDLNGKVVMSVNVNSQQESIQTDNFKSGVYVASFANDKGSKSLKFVVK